MSFQLRAHYSDGQGVTRDLWSGRQPTCPMAGRPPVAAATAERRSRSLSDEDRKSPLGLRPPTDGAGPSSDAVSDADCNAVGGANYVADNSASASTCAGTVCDLAAADGGICCMLSESLTLTDYSALVRTAWLARSTRV